MNKTKSNNVISIILIALAACLIYAVSAGIRSNYGIMLSAISENSGMLILSRLRFFMEGTVQGKQQH